jgi:hypothetical protein
MNVVTDVGAPWYTSGTQKWNGANPNLNANPTTIKIKETIAIVPAEDGTLEIIKVPVAPYQRAMPYNMKAELTHPRRKYFKEASDEALFVTRAPHKQ